MSFLRTVPLVVFVLGSGCASPPTSETPEGAAPAAETTGGGAGYGTSADEGRLSDDPPIDHPSKVRVGQIVTPAGAEVDKQLLARSVRLHVEDLRACYDQGLATRPEMEGRVVYHVALGIDGQVLGINVGETSLPDHAVVDCVKGVLEKVQFDARERQPTRFELPLSFSP